MSEAIRRGTEPAPAAIYLERPQPRHGREFLRAVRASADLHRPWVYPPATPLQYTHYLRRLARNDHQGFFFRRCDDDALVGVASLSEIVRGCFQNAFLGFYAMAPHAGRGLMRAGLEEVLAYAFGEIGLHRLEANIQPANLPSARLAERLGFRREGFSPRLLKIGGQWRDHDRWALLADEWQARGG